MFYDHFTQEQICGLFTPWHFFAIVIFAIVAFFAVRFSVHFSETQYKRALLAIAVAVTVMEAIKISIRVYKGEGGDSWIPLYYCSLFLFAVWLSLSEKETLRNVGCSYMVFGGIVASLGFVIYPSTSLMLFPIWHPSSLHSLLYHWLMFYAGCLVLLHEFYVPKFKHFRYYFAYLSVASALALIVNRFMGTNMMFLSNPFGIGFITAIYQASKALYATLAFLFQSVVIFMVAYGLFYLLVYKRRRRKNGAV